MQNIHEILKVFGLEVPGDQKADFDKAMIENYKTVAEVQKISDKLTKTEGELKTTKDNLSNITDELQTLKDGNANSEDWKKKFDDLSKDIAAKEKEEKEAKEKAEREENILNRYNAVAVDKDGKPLEWTHEAIKADYLHKFSEALNDKANEGKSDADIFNALTKEDGAAFKVPGAQTVFGGANNVSGPDLDDAKINAIMGLK